MQRQTAMDDRQHPRRDVSLVVSCRPKDLTAGYDISETRTISQGGMLLTTARAFASGARLAIWIRLPCRGLRRLMLATVEALGSREVVPSFT